MNKPNNKKLLLILFLITWVLFAVVTFFNHAHNFLGKSFFYSNNFNSTYEYYKENLGKYVLNPFDAEEAKKKIKITKEEIENYRNYYGSLPDQIEDIRMQYVERIEQAEVDKDKELKELLIEERDKKIADIKENFQNDEYVEKKIRAVKEKAIEKYAEDQAEEKSLFLKEQRYFSYYFINIETGEEFLSGEVDSSNIFEQNFGNNVSNLTFKQTDYIDNYDGEGILFDGTSLDRGLSQFEGSIVISKKMFNDSSFKREYRNFTVAQIIFYVIWIGAVLAFVALLTKLRPKKEMFQTLTPLKKTFLKLPLDVRIGLIIFVSLLTLTINNSLVNTIFNNMMYYNILNLVSDMAINFSILYVTTSSIILGSVWVIESINSEEKFAEQGKRAIVYRLSVSIKDLFLKRSVATQVLIVLIGVFIEGMLFAATIIYGGEVFFFFVVCTLFIAIPVILHFLSRMGYLNRIIKDTEEMVEGRFTKEIIAKGKSVFAKHAANLNVLRERVKDSKSEQAKSERLKSELITNVSHDLRTPLTSIITYTDLLKNPHLTEEERNQYIDILDKKSARLKTLIEDLFEVSKMASGSIQLTKQRIDVAQLLQQAIGEHKEAFTQSRLDLRLSMPDYPLLANVDGQKLWRVMDNLIINVLKYSLEGTRIYISLVKSKDNIVFTVKNVSKYELGENVGELTERFKRADASRHTEGSGLGLAIAQSIIDLHGGNLTIDVDGDLFKVSVSIPTE